MKRFTIRSEDVDELFSEDDPYEDLYRYESIAKGRLQLNIPSIAKATPSISPPLSNKSIHQYPASPSPPLSNKNLHQYPTSPSSPRLPSHDRESERSSHSPESSFAIDSPPPRRHLPFRPPPSSTRVPLYPSPYQIHQSPSMTPQAQPFRYYSPNGRAGFTRERETRQTTHDRRDGVHMKREKEREREQQREQDEASEIMDLLAAAPLLLPAPTQSRNFYIDSPEEIRNISLVLQQTYTHPPPPIQHEEIDPALEDMIDLQYYLPPTPSPLLPPPPPSSIQTPSFIPKNNFPHSSGRPTLPLTTQTPPSRQSTTPSSTNLKNNSNSNQKQQNKQEDATEITRGGGGGRGRGGGSPEVECETYGPQSSESFSNSCSTNGSRELENSTDASLFHSTAFNTTLNSSLGSSYNSVLHGLPQESSPKKLRFTSDPSRAPTSSPLANLDEEYLRVRRRELDTLHRDLLEFSYTLEGKNVELAQREAKLKEEYEELHKEEVFAKQYEKDEIAHIRENEKRLKNEIKQMRARNAETHDQLTQLRAANEMLAQKLVLSDSRLKNFRDALTHTKEKGTELQKQFDDLKIRSKKNEANSPGPRTSMESAPIGLINDIASALITSVTELHASGREISSKFQHELPRAFQLPHLSIALFGRLLPYVAKRDEKFQASFLNLLYILTRQESSAPNKHARLVPDLRTFETRDSKTKFMANLVVLSISANSPSLHDVAARALVSLQGCLTSDDGKEQFIVSDALAGVQPLLRSRNRAVLVPAVHLLLSMCGEGEHLHEFLQRCSSEEWVNSSMVALKSNIPEVIDPLCVILEKLSKISTTRSLFHKVGMRGVLNDILLQSPGQFTKMNVASILNSLGKSSEF